MGTGCSARAQLCAGVHKVSRRGLILPVMTANAFGKPGIPPTWCSSDKDFVSTALGTSRLWATSGHGVINEVYWPSTGQPQVRDWTFYLIGTSRWIDLKRVRRYRLATPGPYLPALTITHAGDDYELTLEILPDPRRDVLLVRYALTGGAYRLALIVSPHLGCTGLDNDAWTQGGAGFAQGEGAALCLLGDAAFRQLSCGYVGFSDGWQDLHAHGDLRYDFAAASAGSVALTAEATGASGVLALAFAAGASGALTLARTSLADGFDRLSREFLHAWQIWGEQLRLPRPTPELGDAGLLSAAVLKIHEDRSYPGAVVASLSVPWGNSSDTLGGYHLVWPRDASLSAFALLGAHQHHDVRRMLGHLIATQTGAGHWPQNYFPSGEPFWTGVQLDEAGFPVLLAAKMRELGVEEVAGTAAMVRAAAGFIVRSGPCSEQDRWEENPGVSPFTIAVAIAALIAAGAWLSEPEAAYAASVADDWNDRLEGWCYAADTDLAVECGVAGHYVRLAPVRSAGNGSGRVQLRNRDGESIEASALVSMDFSYLVRLGLRRARDVRITDTIKVADRVLKVDTPSGSLYHRYNEDGYGEHADGGPFDGSGIGRAWPLLVGERGHLALQAGEDVQGYLRTIWNCASVGGMLPEQVWDSAPIPARGLYPGRPSGSAMPLLWTHAEFLKLLIAAEQGRPLELLDVVEQRYAGAAAAARRLGAWHWRDETPVMQLERGRALIIEDREPFMLHVGFDGWQASADHDAELMPLGLWGVTLPASALAGRRRIDFTRRFAAGWEGEDHSVAIQDDPVEHGLAALRAAPSQQTA